MSTIDRIIEELAFSAAGRFSACETQQDFIDQLRLYKALLRERIEEIAQIRMTTVSPQIGDRASCRQCGLAIKWIGSEWRHVVAEQGHIAEPKEQPS